MGCERKAKFSKKRKAKHEERDEDASDGNSTSETGEEARDERNGDDGRRSSEESSPEKSVADKRSRKHKPCSDKRSSRDQSKSSTLDKKSSASDCCRRTITIENKLARRAVDLNYSLTTSSTATDVMPPQFEHRYKKGHSREKSKERKSPARKNEKEKKKEKSVKEHKEPVGKKEKPAVPSCPLCVKPFKSPIVLTCAHTFCKSCVTVLVEAGDGRSYQCPVCLSNSSLTGNDEELFCPNFVILQLLEKGSHLENYTCSVCDKERDAKYYCKNCSDLLCDTCHDAHQVVKYTKDHTVSKLSSSADLSKLVKKKYHCIQHENEKLTMYCCTCRESICRECAFTHHSGGQHKCVPVEDAASMNRDIMKRKLFDIKCRTPKFQLMLLDIKRLKGLLRNQVKSVRVGISTSINTLITSLKEKEKDLCKNADKIFANKLKNLKEQKHHLERELEKHDALGRILIQLDKHENDVEMLQMKEAVIKSFDILDKPTKSSIQCDKHTFLLRSNEVNITKEVNKHGEIYCANKTTGEITLLADDDGEKTPKNSSYGRLKKTARTDDEIIMFTELEDGLLAGNYDGTLSHDGVVQDVDLVEAKELKAKANWLLLKSHLPNIVKYGKTIGRIPEVNDMRGQFDAGVKCDYRTNRRQAKKMKAKANWLLTRARLKQIVQQKTPPQTTLQYKRSPEKQSVLQILRSGTKYSKKLTRVTAIKARARANWLLVRSRLSNIVAYGRITRILPFKIRNLPLTAILYRRKREAKVVASVMHLRAIISRARANWLLVKSRLKDIAKYQPQTPPKTNIKPTWRKYRNILYTTRNHARQNIAESGSVRARANWLILKTLIPDIILFGKYQQNFGNLGIPESERGRKEKPSDDNRSVSTRAKSIPDYVLKNWDTLLDEGVREKRNWDTLLDEGAREKSNRDTLLDEGAREKSNWDVLIKDNTQGKKDSKKTKDASKELLKHWDLLIKHGGGSSSKKGASSAERNESKRRIKEACNLWDVLITLTEGKKDRRNKTCFERISSSQTSTETEHENANIQRKIDSFKNWDKLVSFTPAEHWNTLIAMTPCGDQVTDEYLNSSASTEAGEKEYVRTLPTILRNWKILIGGTPRAENELSVGKGVSFSKSVQSFSEAVADWDRLIRGTAINTLSLTGKQRPKGIDLENWDKLCNTKYQDPRAQHSNGKPPKGKPRAKETDLNNWDKLCNTKYQDSENISKPKDKSEDVTNWDRLCNTKYQDKCPESKTEKSSKGKPRPKSVDLENWDKLCNVKYQDYDEEKCESNEKQRDKSEDLTNWDRLCNTKYKDKCIEGKTEKSSKGKPRPKSVDLENWDKLCNAKYKDAEDLDDINTGGKRGDKSEHLKNWDKLSSTKYPDPESSGQRGDKSEHLKNWDKLSSTKYPDPESSGQRGDKSEHLKNWDKLCNTKHPDPDNSNDTIPPGKLGDESENLNNWDKLCNGKYEEDSENSNDINVAGKRGDKSENLKNWDKLCTSRFDDTYSETSNKKGKKEQKSRAKGDRLQHWDILCNAKFKDTDNSNNKGVKGKPRAKTVDLENWDKLCNSKYQKKPSEEPKDVGSKEKPKGKSTTLDNWDKLRRSSDNDTSPENEETLKNWNKLTSKGQKVDSEEDDGDEVPCKSRKSISNKERSQAYNNWYNIIRDNAAQQKVITNWNKLYSGKSSASECSGLKEEDEGDNNYEGDKEKVVKSKAKCVRNWHKLMKGRISYDKKVSKGKIRRSSLSSYMTSGSSTAAEKLKKRQKYKQQKNKYKKSETAVTNWNVLFAGTILKGDKNEKNEDGGKKSLDNVCRDGRTFKEWDRLISGTRTIIEYEEESNKERAMFLWDTLLGGRIIREKDKSDDAYQHWRALTSTMTDNTSRKDSPSVNWDSLMRGS